MPFVRLSTYHQTFYVCTIFTTCTGDLHLCEWIRWLDEEIASIIGRFEALSQYCSGRRGCYVGPQCCKAEERLIDVSTHLIFYFIIANVERRHFKIK